MKKTLLDIHTNNKQKLSDKWSLYLDVYENIFSDYRELNVQILEIGIQNGGSLEAWAHYFPLALSIIGCDINPDCRELSYDDERISVVIGDAKNEETRIQILNKSDILDIIIDDGSHKSNDVIKTFTNYFPILSNGGGFHS